jgi:predicted dehydrogenase
VTRWGIIGAGGIARVFANGVRFSRSGKLVALASRTDSRREPFAADFSIPRRYSRYEDLLADREVDAVYISVIHPHHARCAIAAAEAGKHILVEKPMAMSAAEAAGMIEAAERADVFLMEAFMYRCHPQMPRLVELIRGGAIGEVRAIRAVMSFSAPFDPRSRLFDKALGGGGVLDVGCYPASISRLVAGAAAGRPFAEPVRLKACAVFGPTGADTFTVATAEFPGAIIAELVCGLACQIPAEAVVYGSRGRITVPNPWLPSSPARTAVKPLPPHTRWPPAKLLRWAHDRDAPEEIVVEADRDLYSYEADAVDRSIARRQAPEMSWEDSMGNMRLLDRWREEIGLRYEPEPAV